MNHANSTESLKQSQCLLVLIDNKQLQFITNETILQKFNQFGAVKSLIVLENRERIKFVIEYETIKEAANACQELNESNLEKKSWKMKISPIAKQMLSNHKTAEQQSVHKEKKINKAATNESFPIDMFKTSPSPFSRSKTQNSINLLEQIRSISLEKLQEKIEQSDVDPQIKSEINLLIDSDSRLNKKEESTPTNQSSSISNNQSGLNNILYFEFTKDMKITSIYNLFSNFGNIACIIKKKLRAYIQFRNSQYPVLALMNLNRFKFLGNILNLQYPHSIHEYLPKENQYCECIYFDKSYDRLTKAIKAICPPSRTLQVSYSSQLLFTEESLKRQFEYFGDVESVFLLQQEKDTRTSLIKFYGIEDSISALSLLHNDIYEGAKFQIKFAEPQI